MNLLERFHQDYIHGILNIEWISYTPDTVILERACSTSIEKRLILYQIRLAGHVVRMGDGRLPKQLFYGELTGGKRPQHKPKGCIKKQSKRTRNRCG